MDAIFHGHAILISEELYLLQGANILSWPTFSADADEIICDNQTEVGWCHMVYVRDTQHNLLIFDETNWYNKIWSLNITTNTTYLPAYL